ncbi:MATE family efflux transporter [Sphaerochaeta sp. PS]|uniref:MATE family efflux transporter n=1 Tax=Sphaerochaeta sp. PS TaxID=3076336 RepID=UPI0028A4876C|nr:MATE family efflux transporter [Sphaerochaeta sp. PS]MDT4762231.1 MATE family efflux transporter [Sphaerochaeta sp. PS]
MDKLNNPLGEKKISTLLMQFSVPAIVGMMVSALYNIVDRIFIGNKVDLGAFGIAGITIVFPIMIVLMAFGVLFGIGGATLFSIKLGQKKYEDAEKTIGNAFILLLIAGLSFSILGQLFLNQILILFGASAEVLPYAKEYMRIIFLGSTFQVMSMGMNNFIRADGNPKIAMLSMFLGAGINLILDPIFIFVLDMGMAGAALATIISQIASTIWVVGYFLGKRSTNKLRLANMHLKKTVVLTVISLGIPPFALQLANSLLNIVLNKTLITYGGNLGISAMGIVNSLQTLLIMPIIGINQGVQPIISFNFGARKFDRVKEAAKLGITAATLLVLLGYLATRFIPTQMVALFNQEPELLRLGTFALRRWFLFTPLVGFQIIGANFFQAIGKPRSAMFLTLSRQVIILIPAIMIFPLFWGLEGILYAAPFADLISTVITAFFFFNGLKNLERKAAVI